MNVYVALVLLAVGLALLVKGADWLVLGAVALAERFGANPLVVGLTIVAMGTSMPEVAANVAAGFRSAGDVAIGNVYGSNVFNLAFIGGLCALIRPTQVQVRTIRYEIPVMLAVSMLLWPVLHDRHFSRGDALLLIGIFGVLLALTVLLEVRQARRRPELAQIVGQGVHAAMPRVPTAPGASALRVGLGLAALAGGAELTVRSAVTLGEAAGLSQAVIGILIVGPGTSLPELLTSLVASVRKQDDISIGNLVGSNIFNALFVTGIAGIVHPFGVGAQWTGVDFWILVAVSASFLPMAVVGRRIGRVDGSVLVGGYLAYVGYLLLA